MGLKKGIRIYGRRVKGEDKTQLRVVDEVALPVSGGRSSLPDVINTFAPGTDLVEIPNDYGLEHLPTLENLAAFNDYMGYAVDNIIQFANTPHEITFPNEVPDAQQKEMKKCLLENQDSWYENSGGIMSLKADLLAQIAINGALSAEYVPTKRLDRIEKVVRVAPKFIVFVYDRKSDKFLPYQQPNSSFYRGTGNMNGLKKLNTTTYKYIAHRRYFETPYGAPPLIAAIEPLCTQKGMNESFKNIMQKLGMLGLLAVNVKPPARKKGPPKEDDEAYFNRCLRWLNTYVADQMKGVTANGMIAGFTDQHEFKLEGNNMNVQGAEGLAKINKQRIFAGVKQDPNMLGENYSTTETFGNVILAKMISQTKGYQRTVDRFFQQLYLTELRLRGFDVKYVMVESEQPIVKDQVKEQDAIQKKISNVLKKLDAGIIDRQTAAEELGYESPALMEEDLSETERDEENQDEITANKLLGTYESFSPYPYLVPEGCELENFMKVSDFHNKKMNRLVKQYFTPIFAQHKYAVNKGALAASKALLNLNENEPLESVQNIAYFALLSNWDSNFISRIDPTIKKMVSKSYREFRNDTTIFGEDVTVQSNVKKFQKQGFEKVVPEGVLDLDDFRTIQYLEDIDELYLGKYITDPDVKKRVFDYIQQNYIEGHLPIGNNKAAVEEFISAFSDELDLVGWKIRRIIDTTVNKARNYANINYLSQAAIETYEVVEVMDQLTCPYCVHMDGKKFDVEVTKEKINAEVQSPGTSGLAPFLTTINISEVEKLSAAELQARGFNSPPYHPHCRGSVVAVF